MKFQASVFAGLMGLALPLYAGTINYQGSSTVGKFITDAAEIYSASTFAVDTVPESGGGEQCALRKLCDMGGVAREVDAKFLDGGVKATLIGKDAIAAIVHQGNPVKALSSAQLKDIFTGKVTNWRQLGGPDLAIHPLVVKEASATRKVFADAVLGGAEYAGVEVVTPDAKILATVARDPGAIGQLSLAFIVGQNAVTPVTVDGHAASVDNPDYPITRPLYITTQGEASGEVKAFLDWALSPEGQAVVKKRFVGVK